MSPASLAAFSSDDTVAAKRRADVRRPCRHSAAAPIVREMLRIPVRWIALAATSALAVATFTATASPAYAASNCGSGYSAWNGLYVTDVRAEGVGCNTARRVAQRAH